MWSTGEEGDATPGYGGYYNALLRHVFVNWRRHIKLGDPAPVRSPSFEGRGNVMGRVGQLPNQLWD